MTLSKSMITYDNEERTFNYLDALDSITINDSLPINKSQPQSKFVRKDKTE